MSAGVYIMLNTKSGTSRYQLEHFGNGKTGFEARGGLGWWFFCEQGDTGWYWTTAGKLKLARGGRERRVLEPRSWSIRSRGGLPRLLIL